MSLVPSEKEGSIRKRVTQERIFFMVKIIKMCLFNYKDSSCLRCVQIQIPHMCCDAFVICTAPPTVLNSADRREESNRLMTSKIDTFFDCGKSRLLQRNNIAKADLESPR